MAVTADLKRPRPGARTDKADDAGGEHDQRKRHAKKEDADESRGSDPEHRPALERTTADAMNRAQHDREHGRFESEEQRRDCRHIAEGGVDIAQRHDAEDAGYDEKPAGNDRARPAVHQPADIGRKLLRLGSGQQHAVTQRMQEPRLADPSLLVDDDAVHHRDLAGGPAKAERGDAQPDPGRLAEGDAVSGAGAANGIGEGSFGHRFSSQALAGGVQLWVSPCKERHQV